MSFCPESCIFIRIVLKYASYCCLSAGIMTGSFYSVSTLLNQMIMACYEVKHKLWLNFSLISCSLSLSRLFFSRVFWARRVLMRCISCNTVADRKLNKNESMFFLWAIAKSFGFRVKLLDHRYNPMSSLIEKSVFSLFYGPFSSLVAVHWLLGTV